MKIITYYTLALPDYSLSYLVNGDASGLGDSDIETIDTWHAEMRAKVAAEFPGMQSDLIIRDTEYSGDNYTPYPEFGLSCNCVEAVWTVWAENEDPRPAMALPWEDEDAEDAEDEDEDEDEDEGLIDVESEYSAIMESEVFRTNGPPIDLPTALIRLGNAVHACPDCLDKSIGEFLECDLSSLIIGAYWSLSEWHAGQYSASYAALCTLGQVFQPGMVSGPEENTGEETAYQCVNAWFESHPKQ